MPKRRSRHSRQPGSLTALRLAIDCMPVATRQAMLAGVRDNQRIIAGAYVDADGGVCPMLAAHRRGGRTDFLSFAHSWDRFTKARGRAQRATAREVAILVSQLEDSLESADGLELDRAIADHRRLRRERLRHVHRPDETLPHTPAPFGVLDPRGEIRARRLWRASGALRRAATERRPAART
ncbi:MAG TPA: hypothetical protein VMI13_08120 [Solirubrobacteraceae bacterium]|nr:hypothetical protein [Solirubrobacteraceae bacterium]